MPTPPDPSATPQAYRVITFKADEVQSNIVAGLMGMLYVNDQARKEAGAQAIEALYHAAFKSMEWVDPNVPLPPVKPVDLTP